ncbi:MAG: molybdate ABC transporter permease subunit [Phycisphaeraceae bacterium]|nr:MAG: molybdate ABC transporter permease subunit [Phycisphaeraceae bacterium]
MDWNAIWLSLRLAACTTVVLLVVGMPLAMWLAWSRFRGRFFVDALVALPLVLPPTVLGFYILWATGPRSPIGQAYESLTGGTLPFSFAGLLLASVLFNLPFAVRPFVASFAAVDKRLIEASWALGESRLATFRRVVLPLSWPGVLAGMVLSFSHTVGEFGVVLMVGGAIPGVTRTISIAIYDDVQTLNYAAAHQTALLLLGFSFIALCITYGLQRRADAA